MSISSDFLLGIVALAVRTILPFPTHFPVAWSVCLSVCLSSAPGVGAPGVASLIIMPWKHCESCVTIVHTFVVPALCCCRIDFKVITSAEGRESCFHLGPVVCLSGHLSVNKIARKSQTNFCGIFWRCRRWPVASD